MLSRFLRALSPFEKRVLVIIILAHSLAITLPYLWVLAVTPDGFVYSGLLYNPDDQNVHLSWARQAAEGWFFFRDLFTTEGLLSGERPLFTNLLAWLIGVLSALTHLPLVWVYHALRVIFAAVTLFLFYALSTRLTEDRRVRIIALALVAFSGGAGFLAPLLPGRNWMDRPDNPGLPMMPEAFTFPSAFVFTLNIASMALLLAVYLFSLKSWQTGSRPAAFGAGLCTLLLANIHTYNVFPLLLTIAAWALWQWRSTPRARFLFVPLVFLGAAIPVLYQLIVFRSSEEFRIKALTETPAPPIWDVLLSYGPLLLLAVLGAVLAWREAKMRLPILWTVSTFLLIYAPVSFARKMIEGLHLPLCFLAAVGLVALLTKLQSETLRRAVAVGVLALLSLSSFQFIAWCLDNARGNNASRIGVLMPPLYLAEGDNQAMQFLAQQPRGKVVLSLPFVGNYVPRETGQTAFIGHWAETLHFQRKLGEVLNFYSRRMTPEEAREWLEKNQIDYVLLGSYENRAGALPLELKEKVFDSAGTQLFAVPPTPQS